MAEEEKQAGSESLECAKDDEVSRVEGTEVSRRQFMRQAALVAGLSLFGVTALDPLVNAVLRRITTVRTVRSVGEAAADELRAAGMAPGAITPTGFCTSPNHPCNITHYNCGSSSYSCTTEVHCTGINHICEINPFGCSETRQFYCDTDDDCYNTFNCNDAHFHCLTDQNCSPWAAYVFDFPC